MHITDICFLMLQDFMGGVGDELNFHKQRAQWCLVDPLGVDIEQIYQPFSLFILCTTLHFQVSYAI